MQNPTAMNPSEIVHIDDQDYNNKLKSSVKYDKAFVVDTIEKIQENSFAVDVNLRFQPGMGDRDKNKFITSLHLNCTREVLAEIKDKVQAELGDDYTTSMGVDAEGDANKYVNSQVTQTYINILATDFDGKDAYFQHKADEAGEIITDELDTDIAKVLILSIADSGNDIPSITSSKTSGLTGVPYNGKTLNAPNSSFRDLLEPVPNELLSVLKDNLELNPVELAKGLSQEELFEQLSERIFMVKDNPSRYIYFGAENEEMSLILPNAHRIMRALCESGGFDT